MAMRRRARQIRKRLRHERRAQIMLFRERAYHEFEERVSVGRGQTVGVIPVNLKLAVGILVIGLIRPPTQFFHGGEELGNEVVAAHEGLCVVTGFRLTVEGVGDCQRIRRG